MSGWLLSATLVLPRSRIELPRRCCRWRLHARPGDTSLQQLRDVGLRLRRVRRSRCDRVADLAPARLAGRARHDDLSSCTAVGTSTKSTVALSSGVTVTPRSLGEKPNSRTRARCAPTGTPVMT